MRHHAHRADGGDISRFPEELRPVPGGPRLLPKPGVRGGERSTDGCGTGRPHAPGGPARVAAVRIHAGCIRAAFDRSAGGQPDGSGGDPCRSAGQGESDTAPCGRFELGPAVVLRRELRAMHVCAGQPGSCRDVVHGVGNGLRDATAELPATGLPGARDSTPGRPRRQPAARPEAACRSISDGVGLAVP
jgi:hypothetical protein